MLIVMSYIHKLKNSMYKKFLKTNQQIKLQFSNKFYLKVCILFDVGKMKLMFKNEDKL